MAITLYCFDEDETIRLLYKVNDCTGPNRYIGVLESEEIVALLYFIGPISDRISPEGR